MIAAQKKRPKLGLFRQGCSSHSDATHRDHSVFYVKVSLQLWIVRTKLRWRASLRRKPECVVNRRLIAKVKPDHGSLVGQGTDLKDALAFPHHLGCQCACQCHLGFDVLLCSKPQCFDDRFLCCRIGRCRQSTRARNLVTSRAARACVLVSNVWLSSSDPNVKLAW